jgi:hypothetical protein
MSKELTASWLRPGRLVIAAAVVLAFAVAGLALQPVFPVSGAPQAQAEDADGPSIVFQVHPTFIKFPESRIRDHGIWFVAAGLEDGQELKIRMVWGAAELETDITSVLDVGFDKELGGLFANVHGAFVVAFERGFRGAAADFLFFGEWTAVSFRLHDAVTDELLAVAPAVLCAPDGEQPWCNYSSELVPIE